MTLFPLASLTERNAGLSLASYAILSPGGESALLLPWNTRSTRDVLEKRRGFSLLYIARWHLGDHSSEQCAPNLSYFRSSSTLPRVTIAVSGGVLAAIPASRSAGAISLSSSTNLRGERCQVANASGECWHRISLNCLAVPLHSCRSRINRQTGWKSGEDFNLASFRSWYISLISASIASWLGTLPAASSRAFASAALSR